jgi:hypothetical protein
LCDAGKCHYNYDEKRGYVLSTSAHNTIEIDDNISGEFYTAKRRHFYGSAIKQAELAEWGCIFTGEVYQERSGVRHTRQVLYGRTKWILLIDRLMSIDGKTPHRFTKWLHFSPHLQGEISENGRYSAYLKSGLKLEVISCCNRDMSHSLTRGQLKPVRQGWISQGYGQLTPADALSYAHEGSSDVTFATLLTIGSTCAQLEISSLCVISINKLLVNNVMQDCQVRMVDDRCALEHIAV